MIMNGQWDAIHVLEVVDKPRGMFNYKITSTILVNMANHDSKLGELDLGGTLTRQVTHKCYKT